MSDNVESYAAKRDKHGRKVPALGRRDTAMRRFEENIDKGNLAFFMDAADPEKYGTFIAMLHDPAYSTLSFSTIAKKCRISLHEMQQIYTDGMRQIGLMKISESIPEVMEDVVEDARSIMETCPRCDGLKIVMFGENGTRECPQCKGDGEVRRSGDKHARDLVFETMKLTKQSGPLVAIQQNFTSGDGRMEDMLKKTRQIVLEPKK